MEDMFDSAVRPTGDLAGVFEFDGETGYFYLYRVDETHGNKVIDAIRMTADDPEFGEDDIAIRWDAEEKMVALLIKDVVWAVFDSSSGTKLGGNYQADSMPALPREVVARFTPN